MVIPRHVLGDRPVRVAAAGDLLEFHRRLEHHALVELIDDGASG